MPVSAYFLLQLCKNHKVFATQKKRPAQLDPYNNNIRTCFEATDFNLNRA